MSYYGLDDDQDLDQWIQQQAAMAPLDELAGPAAMPAYQPPPHAEMAPLEINTGPDWSDALGAGTTALAALADLGLNKGRGMGQILSTGANFGQARAEQRLKSTQDALNYEEKRAQLEKSNRYNDYLFASMAQRGQNQAAMQQAREANIGLRGRDIAVKEANSGRADAKVARDTNADSDYAQQFRDWAVERGLAKPGELNDMSYEQMKSANPMLLKAWEFDHTGEKAQASRAGSLRADLAASDELGDAAAQKALKVQTATQPGAIARIEAGARAKADAERDIGAEGGIPGLVVTDEAAARASLGDQVTKRNLQKAAGGYQAVMGALQEMADLREKNGTMIVGPEAARYETLKQAVVAGFGDIANSGVLNPTDLERFSKLVPGAGLDMKDLTRVAGVDQKLEDLRGALQGFGPQLQAKLKPYGLGIEQSGAPKSGGPTYRATPGGGAGTARSGAMGQVGGMSSGSTGGPVRATPNPDGTFTVPGGSRPYTQQEIQILIAKGLVAP